MLLGASVESDLNSGHRTAGQTEGYETVTLEGVAPWKWPDVVVGGCGGELNCMMLIAHFCVVLPPVTIVIANWCLLDGYVHCAA